jgi:2-oxoisovalerate dehydrogenase E1 component
MYGLASPLNLIVRTPMGGRRGYGPTHSQSLERHFFGAPGLRVVALNTLMDCGEVYGPLLTGHFGPTLTIENKVQYGLPLRDAPDGFDLLLSSEPLPTAWLRPQADEIDVTFVGYGGMSDLLVDAAERAFDEDDLICQVLCPTQVAPFDVSTYRAVFAQTRGVVIVEEGQGFAGFGAEVSAQITARWPRLAGHIRRVAAVADVVPASKPLEEQFLPGPNALRIAALEAAS